MYTENHSLHHTVLLFWYQLFILCFRVLYYKCHYLLSPQAMRHLVPTFIGGTSPVFVNPDRLPLTRSTSYRGSLYRCVVLRSVYCVVCVCCVLWRDGAWDGVVVLASVLFHQQLMRGEGKNYGSRSGKHCFRVASRLRKLQLKPSSPPPWPPPRRRP